MLVNGDVSFYEIYLEKEIWKEYIISYCIGKEKVDIIYDKNCLKIKE